MNARRVIRFFEERRSRRETLILATVIETDGSTYSKAGEQMLIDNDGNYCGMLSGGCLEGDLVERSRSVIATGAAQTATYDLNPDDELWGLGVGCSVNSGACRKNLRAAFMRLQVFSWVGVEPGR